MCERLKVTSLPFRPLGGGRGALRKKRGMLRLLLQVLLPPALELVVLMEEQEEGSVRGVEVPVKKG